MEVERRSLAAKQRSARDMLRGDLEGEDLERYVEERVVTTTFEKMLNLAHPRCRLVAVGAMLERVPSRLRRQYVHISNESLLVILVVGLVAGWLAGQIVRGTGFGLIGDLIVGIIGAFIGDRLLPRIGIHLGTGIVSAIINATIGAVILLLVVRLVRGSGRFGGGLSGRWGR